MTGIVYLAAILAAIIGGDLLLVALHRWADRDAARTPRPRPGAVDGSPPAPPAPGRTQGAP